MDYAQQQRQPGKHLTGITVVIVLHAIVVYALVTGLARKAIVVIKQPMTTKVIEEVKKPPPPDTPPPPPPKLVQIIPTFVPPPEVQISSPVVQAVISNPTPIAPPVYAPPKPVVAAPPPAPPAVGTACPNSQQIRTEIKYPAAARKDGIQGDVLVEFTVATNGEIKDVDVKSSSNRVFNSVSVNAVRQFKCNAQARDVRVQVPFSFKLTD